MKNRDKVDIAFTLFGLSFGGLVLYEGVKHNDFRMAYLGSLLLYATVFYHVILFLAKREKKIKKWLDK